MTYSELSVGSINNYPVHIKEEHHFIHKCLEISWKWICFIGWLIWFFISYPWQMKKAYAEVMSAISDIEINKDNTVCSDIQPNYYIHLN
jgi:hypothetical protein